MMSARHIIGDGLTPHIEGWSGGQLCQPDFDRDLKELFKHGIALTVFFDDFLSHLIFLILEFGF
jgi:hypothetical protein